MDEKATAGVGNPILVKDYRHVIIAIATEDSANMTIKAVGSIEEAIPDFTAAQSVGNMYDFIEMVDYQSGSKISGDTGIVFSGTDDFRILELNTNGLEWMSLRMTARSAGKATVKVLAVSN